MRARRRHDVERLKAKARRIMALWFPEADPHGFSARAVGRNAATHCRPCSCALCRGPRHGAERARRRVVAADEV